MRRSLPSRLLWPTIALAAGLFVAATLTLVLRLSESVDDLTTTVKSQRQSLFLLDQNVERLLEDQLGREEERRKIIDQAIAEIVRQIEEGRAADSQQLAEIRQVTDRLDRLIDETEAEREREQREPVRLRATSAPQERPGSPPEPSEGGRSGQPPAEPPAQPQPPPEQPRDPCRGVLDPLLGCRR